MSAFSKVDKVRAPGDFVVLQPNDFADAWEGRPTHEVAIGLRLVPTGEDETARAEATRKAWELFGRPEMLNERLEVYFDALMRWVVGKAACDPNDVDKPYFAYGEDTVREALTTSGVRKFWDAYERFVLATSIFIPPIERPQLEQLVPLLTGGALEMLPSARQLRAKKLLSFVLSELTEP